MTRGVLIDVAALKGVDMLQGGYEITIEDLQAALKRQGTVLRAGDAVLIHGGWGKLWGKDNARYQTAGHAGIGVRAAEWLIKQDPILLGHRDSPNPDKQISLPVGQRHRGDFTQPENLKHDFDLAACKSTLALVVHGVHLLENLKLDELAAKNVLLIVSTFIMPAPSKLAAAATGSTVAPVAVRLQPCVTSRERDSRNQCQGPPGTRAWSCMI